jgi:hypothetical protein
MCTVADEAIARGMVPLLNFVDFASRMSMPDGYFRAPLSRALETFVGSAPFFSGTFRRLAKTCSIHFFSSKPRQKRALGEANNHPRNFEHMVQATVVWKTSNARFTLHSRVTAHNISSFLCDPRQQMSIIFFIFTRQGKSW